MVDEDEDSSICCHGMCCHRFLAIHHESTYRKCHESTVYTVYHKWLPKVVKSYILCLPSCFIKRGKLGNPLVSWGISIGIHHRYPLVIKHGWLEHPRTEWRFIAGKITDFKGPGYKSIILLAINLHSVQEFSSHV